LSNRNGRNQHAQGRKAAQQLTEGGTEAGHYDNGEQEAVAEGVGDRHGRLRAVPECGIFG